MTLSQRDSRGERRRPVVVAIALISCTVIAAVMFRAASRTGTPGERVAEGFAPQFDLPFVGDASRSVSLAQFSGGSVVVNFWASWCIPCRKEMPAFQVAADRLVGRVAFVGINEQDSATAAADFQHAVGVRYPSGSDPSGRVAALYGVRGLPTTVVMDAAGRIVGRRVGQVDEEQLLELIRSSLGPGVA